MKRTISTIVAFCIPLGLYWLGGNEFIRGAGLSITFGSSVVLALFTYAHSCAMEI